MKPKRGFTLIEILIVITIIGILMTLITVSIASVQRRSRDSRRKADMALMRGQLDLFKADFKIYPNYTFYLGDNSLDLGAKDSSFKLAPEINECTNLPGGAPTLFATAPTDLDNAVLLQGFDAINSFLICLNYTENIVKDPIAASDTAGGYQYRVSFDYAEMIVSAKLENPNDPSVETLFNINPTNKRYIEGTGKTARQLADDSHIRPSGPLGFFSSVAVGNNLNDGFYLYQCLVKQSDGTAVTRDERSSGTFQPIIFSGGTWAKNSSCRDNLATDLQVVRAFGREASGGGGSID